MIIIGLSGTLCSGKKTAAEYLQMCYGFKIINLESESWDSIGGHSSNPHTEDDYPSEESYRESNARLALHSTEDNIAMNYVVYPITLPEELSVFRCAMNFMLIGIDAPALKRFGHYNVKYVRRKSPLTNFLEIDDKVRPM